MHANLGLQGIWQSMTYCMQGLTVEHGLRIQTCPCAYSWLSTSHLLKWIIVFYNLKLTMVDMLAFHLRPVHKKPFLVLCSENGKIFFGLILLLIGITTLTCLWSIFL